TASSPSCAPAQGGAGSIGLARWMRPRSGMQRRSEARSNLRLHGRIPTGAPAPRSGARPKSPRSRMPDLIRASLSSGLGRRRGAPAVDSGSITLTQHRIYILPTRAGVLFGLTVVVMLLGCVNYNLGLGYVLTFLMSGIGIVSILHTFRNLVRLQLKPGRPE